VLHDTAASTLLMVGEGVPASANDRIRRQASRDLATLGQLGRDQGSEDQQPVPEGMDLIEAIRELLQGISIQVGLRIPPGADLKVPDRVGRSIIGAVGEALTNIERHSGADHATIAVELRGDEIEITVSDAGAGFDPAHRGRGLNESVIARMQRVGGAVDIRSNPGHGTVIELRWRPS
jgi:signal transduction histidine kinase